MLLNYKRVALVFADFVPEQSTGLRPRITIEEEIHEHCIERQGFDIAAFRRNHVVELSAIRAARISQELMETGAAATAALVKSELRTKEGDPHD
jgi:hypothetical protein